LYRNFVSAGNSWIDSSDLRPRLCDFKNRLAINCAGLVPEVSRSHRGQSRSAWHTVKVFAIKDNRGGLPSEKEGVDRRRADRAPQRFLVIDTVDTIITSYPARQNICELLRLIYDKDAER